MSYRDLRNFTEMMRALGYPRLISMENFRNPNFPLVAEILIWLIHRFDPNADIPTEFDTEQDHVMLVRSAAQFMASKGHIKLNTKRLYQADGYAVRELLKVTTILYSALKINTKQDANADNDEPSALAMLDVSSKINELKQSRQLASEITRKGAALFDLLGKEVELRELRNIRVNHQVEMTEAEGALRLAMETVRTEIQKTNQLIENVAASEASLDSKIEKKKVELERNQKRLQTLRKVRPAFSEEFERLEEELRQLYCDYVVRFRCLAYLEQLQDDAENAERKRMEERQTATRRLLEELKQEDGSFRSLEASGDLFSAVDENESDEDGLPMARDKTSKVKIKSTPEVVGGNQNPATQRRVFGSMTGTEDDTGSLDSDSDLLLDGDGEGTDLGSEEELDVEKLGVVAPKQDQSDDDF